MKRNYYQLIYKIGSILHLDLEYYLRSGFWITLSNFVSFIGGILLSAIFARVWPSDVFGKYSFFISMFSIITVTALPGMGQIVLQAGAEGSDGTYKEALKEVGKWSIIGSTILLLGSIYFWFRLDNDLTILFLGSILAFPLSNVGNLYISFLSGKKKFKKMAQLSILYQLFTIGSTAIVLLLYPSLTTVGVVFLYSNAVISVIVAILAGRESKNDRIDHSLLKFGKHLSFSQVFTLALDQFDRFFIPLVLGFTNNAIYAFAILIPNQIHVFLKVFLTLGQTKIAEANNKHLLSGLIGKTLQLEIVIALITLSYIIAAPSIFHILYPKYQGSSLFLSQIYSISLLYYPGNFFNLGLIKYRASNLVYANTFISFAVNVIFLIALTFFFGLIGAVVAKVLARFVQALISYLFFSKYINPERIK